MSINHFYVYIFYVPMYIFFSLMYIIKFKIQNSSSSFSLLINLICLHISKEKGMGKDLITLLIGLRIHAKDSTNNDFVVAVGTFDVLRSPITSFASLRGHVSSRTCKYIYVEVYLFSPTCTRSQPFRIFLDYLDILVIDNAWICTFDRSSVDHRSFFHLTPYIQCTYIGT